MSTKILSIIFFTLFVLVAIIRKYMLEKNIKKVDILENEKKLDNFINTEYKKILLVFVLLIAISRIYKFGEIPQYIGVDEAGAAYDAYCLANYGVDRYLNKYPVYLINFGGGQSALYAYVTIIFIKLIGTNIIAYRLPELLFYIAGIIVSYILANKLKDKKTALLLAFLIIICPWNIEASREGLDCNLLSPMFMIDLLLLVTAKKNYQYILAGISIGITLYTYCLSYMLIPAFLLVYIIYMLYIKQINFKQIILLGIPIFIFALPLMYMILLNKGIVTRTDFGFFTVPKLFIYREGEINLKNIYYYGLTGLTNIFIKENSLYLIILPFFLIGCYVAMKETIKSIKTKTFDITVLIFMSLVVMFIVNFTVKIGTINKANILFIPILYITVIGMIYMCNKSIILTAMNIIFLTMLFICYEFNYYIPPKDYMLEKYRDNEIGSITNKIEASIENEDAEKYIITTKVEPYIYTLLEKKISPYDFYSNVDIKIYERGTILKSYEKYHFQWDKNLVQNIEENKSKYIIAINKVYNEQIKFLLDNGFSQEDFKSYYIMKNY